MARRSPAVADDWLTRASLLGSALLVLIGALVMVGWAQRIDLLVQLRSNYTPMQPNTAASLIVLGAALLALETGMRRGVWLAAVPALLGFLTLVQYLAGWNLHLDDFLQSVYIAVDPTFPGRMPRLTAAAVCASGLSILWRNLPFWTRRRPIVLALVASLIVALGLAPLLGWALGLSVSSAWSQVIQPAPLPALSLTLLGGLLLSRVWREDPDRAAGLPRWLPAPVLAAGVTLTLLFTAALRDREIGLHPLHDPAHRQQCRHGAELRAGQRGADPAAHGGALDRRSASSAATGATAKGRPIMEDFPALRSLTWIDRIRAYRLGLPGAGQRIPVRLRPRQGPAAPPAHRGRCRAPARRRFRP